VKLGCILALAVLFTSPATGSAAAFPDDDRIRAELRAFIELHRGSPGVVVGILEPEGRRVIAEGRSGRAERQQMDASTRFEIGSITKTFTGVLLADMMLAGEVSGAQRIGELFPSDIPLANGIENATIEQLATHSSGLPRLALNLPTILRLFSQDPYRGSSAEDIFRTAAEAPDFQISTPGRFAYSNLGYALLGRLLERRAGQAYEPLLRARVLEPLGLGGIATAHEQPPPATLAVGHGPGGRPAPYWHLDGYGPAGCLIASTDEMLRYVELNLAEDQPVLAEAQRSRRRLRDGSGVGLAWMHDSIAGRRVIWHNGGTGGFRSYAGFIPEERRALVVLANGHGDVDALARRLLDPEAPPLPEHKRSAKAMAMTVGLLLCSPLLLFGPMAAALAAARGDGTASTPVADPAPDFAVAAKARPRRSRLDRLDLLQLSLSAVIALILADRMGAWRDLPFALWWCTAALTAVGLAWVLGRAGKFPWRRPGAWSTVGRGLLTALSAGILLAVLASCAPTEKAPDSTAQPGGEADGPTSSSVGVDPMGFGPIRVGMTVAEAERALGSPLPLLGPKMEPCYYVTPKDRPGLAFMIFEGRVARVDVHQQSIVRTAEGAGIGDPEDHIQSLYPGRVEVQPHKYTEGRYLIVRPAAPADSGYRIIFETDGTQVTRYRAGRLPEVGWVEGCS
jgi:CubicO group peptidase (beta-lactamase class C family)